MIKNLSTKKIKENFSTSKICAFLIVMLLFAGIYSTNAQEKTITGLVISAKGVELPGVNIVQKGTTNGVVTDFDGKYSIKLELQGSQIIVFSYIGFKTTEVQVDGNSVINIVLQDDSEQLNEVVVIGYGSVKRRDVTGAVTSIKEDVFEQSKQSSFVESLQGRVAGLNITTSSGEPGSASKIIIRGANSLAGSSDPLFVIDGVLVNESAAPVANSSFGSNSSRNPLSSINSNDIVSIEVLKDASATAIYGSKGANGVILVTTRKGKSGKMTISYDGRTGVSFASNKLEMLNGDEFIDYRKDWVLMPDGKRIVDGYFRDPLFFLNPGETEPSLKEPRNVYTLEQHDWQDEMYRTAFSRTHNLSISGGNEYTKYYGSVGVNYEEGILINNDYSRYNAMLKIDHNKNKFKMGFSIRSSFSEYGGAAQSGDGYANIGVIQAAVISRPLVFSSELDNQTVGGYKEPTTNLEFIDRKVSTPNISANINLSYELAEGLYFQTNLGGSLVNSNVKEFYGKETPWGFALKGRAAITDSNWKGFTSTTSLFYSKTINSNSSITALAATEISGSDYFFSNIIMSNFADGSTGYNDISKGLTLQNANSGAGLSHQLSYISRATFDYMSKYLFTGSFRADGSDRFGKNNRFGYFPSAAFAWRMSDENFLKDSKLINNLKFRLSYGLTGNQNIPQFQYMARLGNSFYGDQLGLAPSAGTNPDLKWESTEQANAGVDVSLFQNRLDITVDVYKKITTDMLYNAIIPSQSGFKTQWQNLGEIENKGIEVTLNSVNIRNNNFEWSTNFTAAANKNKVIDIGNGLDTAPIGGGFWSTSLIKLNDVGRIMKGQPIGVMWGYELEGIYQIDDFSGWNDKSGTLPSNDPNIPWHVRDWQLKDGVVDATSLAQARPGTFKFKNLDGSDDNKISEDDKTIIGNSQPKVFGGLSNNFKYKGFDLGIFLTYSIGGDIFNSTKYELEGAFAGDYWNITKEYWNNRWTPDNPTNEYPSYSDSNYYNTLSALPNSYYIEDASYVRLQTVSLSYTLPREIPGFTSIKFYYSGNNLFTWTKYSGFSPDVNSGNPLLPNFDTIRYPLATSHQFGMTLTF